MSLIKHNRNATNELFDKMMQFLDTACHCTVPVIENNGKIQIYEKDDETGVKLDYLGSIFYEKDYITCSVHIGYASRNEETLRYIDTDANNIKKVATELNELRIDAGVQCTDWSEVKVALGIE